MGVQLTGATAAVTGAGRGIGRATAKALARAGARVALGDLDADMAREAAAEIGAGAVGLPLDVTSRTSFVDFIEAAEDTFGPLDVLVNNAGIMHVGRFVEEDDNTTRGQVEINILGVLTGMKLALPGMVARGRGGIVNLASVAGKGGFPRCATYSATKHAVVGASEALRGELRGTGVQVSAVLPYVVSTELSSGFGTGMIPVQSPEAVARAVVTVLRTGRAEVFVPRYVMAVHAVLAPLPPSWRAAMGRKLGADRVLTDQTEQARTEYEARAGASAAGVMREP
jgi:short-subunit dehydrogenase